MASEKTVNFWIKSQSIFEDICNKCDKTWQKRKRILSTKLLVIFIIKLVLSKNKQGYASSLLQLWDTCVEKGIQLPQVNSIAPSSLCEARQKLPENVFMDLNLALLEHWNKSEKPSPTWHGHKVFAVDGSKINLPRGLLNYGYTTAKDRGRYYPQGTMSCLYNLHEQIAYDFTFVSHGDERACAIEHFKCVDDGDIVIFDRGYFSYFMFYTALQSNINVVFRMQNGTVNGKVAEFWKSDLNDIIIEYMPSETVKSDLRKRGHKLDFKPVTMRLIKHKIKDETYVYATTLIGEQYPSVEFGALYHSRWGIEELYKISKCFIDVEDFHSQTERGVKHELYAHILLINIARMFETEASEMLLVNDRIKESNEVATGDNASLKTNNHVKINFKNCILVVARYLENLILAPHNLIATWINKAICSIARVTQRVRPGRSYQRISHKPRGKWDSFRTLLKA
jgi:hypothetical protein